MGELIVANATALEPFLKALPFSQSKNETMLEAVGLSASLLENPVGALPLFAVEQLLCNSSRATKDRHFGFRAVQDAAFQSRSHVANIPLPGKETGLELAKLFARQLNGVLSGNQITWALQSGTFWILRNARSTNITGNWSVVQYNLAIFLEGMRGLFGAGLRPTALRTGRILPKGDMPDDLVDIPVITGGKFLGFGFAISSIMASDFRRLSQKREQASTAYHNLHQLDEATLATSVAPFLGHHSADKLLDIMALAFGVSPRTYQRRLAEVGTNHSKVLAKARLHSAYEMLIQSDQSVTSISYDLGYGNPGDFTRFFKIRTGYTPRDFRKVAHTGGTAILTHGSPLLD